MKPYTFHNSGTVTSFSPMKRTTLDGEPVTSLDFHKELVQRAGRKDVFICDHRGRIIEVQFNLALAA